MDWIDVIFNLLFTALVYLFVPIVILVSGKKYKVSAIKKIAVINGIACFLIFSVIQIELGNDGASVGAFALWSGVGYWILNKKCLKVETAIKCCPHCGADIQDNAESCFSCGCIIKTNTPQKRSPTKRVSIIAVFILFILSMSLNVLFGTYVSKMTDTIENLESTVELLETKNEVLSDTLSDYKDELAFYDEWVVFVEDDGTNLYHKYECSKFLSEAFWAFNVDAAIDSGYEPCGKCCNVSTSDEMIRDFTNEYFEAMKQ